MNTPEQVKAALEAERALYPKFLYKYRSGSSYDLDAFTKKRIWVSSFAQLNDPHDGNLEIRSEVAAQLHDHVIPMVARDAFGEAMWIPFSITGRDPRTPPDADVREKYEREAAEMRQWIQRMGVYCVTGDPLNVHMWTYYGGGFGGYCIEYPFDMALFDLADGNKPVNRVNYIDRYPRVDIGVLRYDAPGVRAWKLLGHKSKKYEHEQEWRFIYHKGDYLDEEPCLPSSVIFGPKTKPDLISNVREAIKQRGDSISLKRLLPISGDFGFKLEDFTV